MLYGDFHIITKEIKDHLCELLHQKGVIEKDICSQIIEIFSSTQKHVSVKEFHQILQGRGIDIAEEKVAVVFRIMSEIGFASELQFEGEDFKRYEPFRQDKHHDHFICVKCKKVIEFTSEQLENLQDSLIFQKGCKPLFHKLEVYGLCNECQPADKKILPITLVPENETVRFSRAEGGWHLRKRLTDLGFVPGASIKIIKNSHFGPIVLEVQEARLAVGRGEAQKILVYEG